MSKTYTLLLIGIVNYSILENDLKDGQLLLEHLERTFINLKPDYYVINQDAFDIPFRRSLGKKYNIPIKILKRQAPVRLRGISTSGIIAKIKEQE